MSDTIHIDIDSEGNVRVEGVDIVGSDCKLLTKEIEGALGTVTKEMKKPQFSMQRKALRKTSA